MDVEVKVRNVQGQVVDSIEVRDDVFGVAMNQALVHQVMVGQLANARQGTASTKTRAHVSGGGAKPRPQKGTGRARQGSIRSPQFRGGGVVFGPHPRSYRHRTPKRMRRMSLVAVLSDKVREDQPGRHRRVGRRPAQDRGNGEDAEGPGGRTTDAARRRRGSPRCVAFSPEYASSQANARQPAQYA